MNEVNTAAAAAAVSLDDCEKNNRFSRKRKRVEHVRSNGSKNI
jgi:hypothetical protein